MLSRTSKDRATSRGFRIGETIRGFVPKVLTASIQKGSNRHILGSFRTNSGLSPNSFFRIV